MKFTCEAKKLVTALTEVNKAVPTKSAAPILEGALMVLKDNELTLTGYDLKLGVIAKITVTGNEDGAIVTNACSLFLSALKNLTGDVEISTENGIIKISSANAAVEFAGADAENYPHVETSPKSNEIDGNMLKEGIDSVLFAVDEKSIKPYAQGALIRVKDGNCEICATNGIGIALFQFDTGAADVEVIVPKSALDIISDFAKGKAKVHFDVSHNQCFFGDGNIEIFTGVLAGPFFDYSRFFDTTSDSTKVTVNRAKLKECLEMANLIRDKAKTPVELNITADEIQVKIAAARGRSAMRVACESEVNLTIYFNPSLLLEALSRTAAKEVSLYLTEPLKPCKIEDNYGYSALVLPVRNK